MHMCYHYISVLQYILCHQQLQMDISAKILWEVIGKVLIIALYVQNNVQCPTFSASCF